MFLLMAYCSMPRRLLASLNGANVENGRGFAGMKKKGICVNIYKVEGIFQERMISEMMAG